jgi:hypothetical protein
MPKALSYEELREFDLADLGKMNKIIVELIRVKNRERDLTAGASFKGGDVAKFVSSKTGQVIYGRVDTINPKSLIMTVLQEDGTPGTARYRVSPSICTKSTVADAIDAMKPKLMVPPKAAAIEDDEEFDEDEDEAPAPKGKVAAPEEISDPSRDVPVGAEEAW